MYTCSTNDLRKINSCNVGEKLAEYFDVLDRTMQDRHHFLFIEGHEEASACTLILPRRDSPSLFMHVLNGVIQLDGRKAIVAALENALTNEHLVVSNICGTFDSEIQAAYLANDKNVVGDSCALTSHGKKLLGKAIPNKNLRLLTQMMRPIENLPDVINRFFAAPFGKDSIPEVFSSPRRQIIAEKVCHRPHKVREEPPVRVRELPYG